MTVRSLSLALLCTLAAGAARADWQGDLKMKEPPRPGRHGPPGGATGSVHFKQGKMRFEVQMGPMSLTTLTDFAAKKSFLINDASKTFTDMSEMGGGGPGAGANVPHCSSNDFEGCMKEQGFKKVGAEEVNGQASTVWEGDRKVHGPRGERVMHEKIWHPNAAGKEFAFVRMQSTSDGHEGQIDVENFSTAEQDAKKFEIPEGYTKGKGFGFGPVMGPPGMHGRPPPGAMPPSSDKGE
jgi:hypothetical protein